MNDRNPELKVDATTGVEVTLPIAGAGGRSYAFIIDWHIRVLLALAWWLVAAAGFSGGFTSAGSGAGADSVARFLLITLPPLAIYFLYHPILEIAMRGRTPGKRMAGIRIVTRDGASPGVGALLIRNAFRLIDSLPAFYCLGLGFVMSTAQHVRIGDLAAGTLLVYDKADARAAVFPRARTGGIDPRVDELIDELVARWVELTPDARTTIGRRLLERVDPGAGTLDETAIFERLRSMASAHG
jgi:uncharacterized RDD family membrane protein YckC